MGRCREIAAALTLGSLFPAAPRRSPPHGRPIGGLLVAALALAAPVIAGCVHGSDVLARVGAQTITVSDLVTAGRRAVRADSTGPQAVREELLDALVTRALLLEVGEAMRLLPDSLLVRLRVAPHAR